MKAQNLVPNPYFEDKTDCPSSWGQINKVDIWFNPSQGTPDYYCTCNFTPEVFGLPDTIIPFDSICFVAFVIGTNYLNANNTQKNSREYVSVKLKEGLVNGREYCVSFYYRVSKNSKYFIDKLGVLFTEDSIYQANQFTIENNTFLSMSDSILSDTLNWKKLEKKYTANGNEKYITIGNFLNDDEVNILLYPNGTSSTYIYVDYISVEDCTVEEVIFHHSIYPNPSNGGQITLEVYDDTPIQIIVHNEIGQLVYTENLPKGHTQKSLELNLATGLYYVTFEKEGIRVKTEKLVVLK